MIVIKILFGIFFLSLLVTGIAYLFNAPKSEWRALSQPRPRKSRRRVSRNDKPYGLPWMGGTTRKPKE